MTENQSEGDVPSLGAARQAEAEYRAALARVADEVGVSAAELEQRVADTAEGLQLTPDCLTLAEIERCPTLTSLPKSRQRHVRDCSVCTDFLKAITPSPEERQWFMGEATRRPLGGNTPVIAFWRPALLGAGTACAVAVLVFGIYNESVRNERGVWASQLAVAKTLVAADVKQATATEQQLQQVYLRASESVTVKAQASTPLVLKELVSAERPVVTQIASLESGGVPEISLAIEADQSSVWLHSVSRSVASRLAIYDDKNKAGPKLKTVTGVVERLYLDAAHQTFAQVPREAVDDADSVLKRFTDLETIAFQPDSAPDAWIGPYLQLHGRLKTLISAATETPGAVGTTEEKASNPVIPLRQSVAYLEKFAGLRFDSVIDRDELQKANTSLVNATFK